MRLVSLAAAALMAGLLATPAPALGSDHSVGDTVQLSGNDVGELLAVTLTKVVNPAPGSDEFDKPGSGNRLVATQFRIADIGTTTFVDSPDNDVQLIDSAGQSYYPSLTTVASGPSFPGEVRIPPGDSRLGYVVFDVPAKATVAQVQFVPDSGFAAATGTWTVPAESPRSAGRGRSPARVVEAYIAAINAGDYRKAWALGARNLGGTYASFAAGFSDTAHDVLTVTGTSGDVVHVRLDAEQTDGSHRVYRGTYTVRGGTIVAAHLVRQ